MSESKPQKPKDIAILGGPTEDGQGAKVLRIREGIVSEGEIRPVKEGETITHNEVVRLRPLDAENRVCEVEVLHSPATSKPAQLRPTDDAASKPRRARVSTPNYRKNWSAIFEQKPKRRSKSDWSIN
jgi:hypothetical protein